MSAPPWRPVPVLRGARVTLRPPAPADSEVARRIGLHPEILLGYGEEMEEWRELTVPEAAELLARRGEWGSRMRTPVVHSRGKPGGRGGVASRCSSELGRLPVEESPDTTEQGAG